jgi:hypothetical protein
MGNMADPQFFFNSWGERVSCFVKCNVHDLHPGSGCKCDEFGRSEQSSANPGISLRETLTGVSAAANTGIWHLNVECKCPRLLLRSMLISNDPSQHSTRRSLPQEAEDDSGEDLRIRPGELEPISLGIRVIHKEEGAGWFAAESV